MRIQPEEGISLKFLSKRPGAGMKLRPVSMDFNYGSSFGERSPSAYETLLLDAIVGDATLYTRQDMVEASWAVVEPIQNVWRESRWISPTTPREPGDRPRRTPCWPATATSGGNHNGGHVSGDNPEGTRRSLGDHAASGAGEAAPACCAPAP